MPASIQGASSLTRRSWIVVFLVATAIPLNATKHTTVAQLQQALNTAINAHKPDTEIALEIGGFELTERLTEATLGQLKARLVPGTQGARALELLADRSAFFDPPANELPATPAPDSTEQTRILQAARRYVSQTLPRLPDFFATRVISLYDDRPQALKKDTWPIRSGLHLIDTSSGEISVRNERENQPATQGSAVWQANVGLISGGEFGNTLGMILADTANGNIRWSHWEESAKGRVAVFRYEVPASASHYEVLNAVPSNPGIVHTKPGYHGSIGVSPADGTILRITMDADLTRGAPFAAPPFWWSMAPSISPEPHSPARCAALLFQWHSKTPTPSMEMRRKNGSTKLTSPITTVSRRQHGSLPGALLLPARRQNLRGRTSSTKVRRKARRRL